MLLPLLAVSDMTRNAAAPANALRCESCGKGVRGGAATRRCVRVGGWVGGCVADESFRELHWSESHLAGSHHAAFEVERHALDVIVMAGEQPLRLPREIVHHSHTRYEVYDVLAARLWYAHERREMEVLRNGRSSR